MYHLESHDEPIGESMIDFNDLLTRFKTSSNRQKAISLGCSGLMLFNICCFIDSGFNFSMFFGIMGLQMAIGGIVWLISTI
jgi:hypothetical protein